MYYSKDDGRGVEKAPRFEDFSVEDMTENQPDEGVRKHIGGLPPAVFADIVAQLDAICAQALNSTDDGMRVEETDASEDFDAIYERLNAERARAANTDIAEKSDVLTQRKVAVAQWLKAQEAEGNPVKRIYNTLYTYDATSLPNEDRSRKAKARKIGHGTIRTNWENSSSLDRYVIAYNYAEAYGGVAFSLNFSKAVREALYCDRDPVKKLRENLSRHVRDAFGEPIELAFILEFTKAGVLHMHGIAILPELHDVKDRFRLALKKTGGKIKWDEKGKTTQTKIKGLFSGKGWLGYTSKDYARTQAMLNTQRIEYRSDKLTRSAREWHDSQKARAART